MSTLGQVLEALTQYVSLSPEYIRKRYDHWNKMAFDGALPDNVAFKIGSLPKMTAASTHMPFVMKAPKRLIQGLRDYSRFIQDPGQITVTFNPSGQMTEEMLDGILLHEMVHVQMASKLLVFAEHGEVFMKHLKEAERKAGRRIPVGHGVDQQTGDFASIETYPSKEVILIVKVDRRDIKMIALFSSKNAAEVDGFIKRQTARNAIYRDAKSIEVYLVNTRLASAIPVQRNLASPRMTYYRSDDLESINGVEELNSAIKNGKKLGEISLPAT